MASLRMGPVGIQRARRESLETELMVVDRQDQLRQNVGALHASRGFSGCLHSRKQESYQNANDGDNYQKLYQGKATSAHSRTSHYSSTHYSILSFDRFVFAREQRCAANYVGNAGRWNSFEQLRTDIHRDGIGIFINNYLHRSCVGAQFGQSRLPVLSLIGRISGCFSVSALEAGITQPHGLCEQQMFLASRRLRIAPCMVILIMAIRSPSPREHQSMLLHFGVAVCD